MTKADSSNQARDPSAGELNAALPRKVRLHSDEAKRLYWFVASLLALSIIWFAYYGRSVFKQSQQRAALHSEGRDVLGQVSAKNQSRSGVFVHYFFKVDGTVYQGKAELPTDRHVEANVGQPIRIRYLPSEPSVSHPSDWDWSAEWDVVLNLIMLFVIGIGVRGAVMLYRERDLARKGWIVEGKVTSCVPKGRRFCVDYEFHTDDRTLMEGSNDYWGKCEVGSRILIIYLRNNPERNDCYPLSGYHTV